ncbi:EGF-like domain-containing protein [Trichonephila clavipes]|nr:EGF-like domain-containing protein [Trichonephila clavipes]
MMLFLITIVCITSTLAEQVENFQPYNETELDFHNGTECDCGPHYESCSFNGFQKSCVCEHGYSDRNGTCTKCDCGSNASSCNFDSDGVKYCVCDGQHAEYKGSCVECDCGLNAFTCYYDKRDVKTCVCKNGYVGRNGTCIESCAWSGCPENQVCRPNKEGQDICQCKPHFGGKDCKINLLCEKLEPMCRDMGAACIVENSEAICRCPWGQIVGLPSGICEGK